MWRGGLVAWRRAGVPSRGRVMARGVRSPSPVMPAPLKILWWGWRVVVSPPVTDKCRRRGGSGGRKVVPLFYTIPRLLSFTVLFFPL